jgi:hypothetical protein
MSESLSALPRACARVACRLGAHRQRSTCSRCTRLLRANCFELTWVPKCGCAGQFFHKREVFLAGKAKHADLRSLQKAQRAAAQRAVRLRPLKDDQNFTAHFVQRSDDCSCRRQLQR